MRIRESNYLYKYKNKRVGKIEQFSVSFNKTDRVCKNEKLILLRMNRIKYKREREKLRQKCAMFV
jgi:hypothetical protein